MAKKKPSILEKADDIFKEDEEELSGELFDVNAGKGMVRIKINRLIPNPDQPRKTFYEQTISELAESIKQHGILSPIIVRPLGSKYEIIAGERRFRAAEQAGLKEVPAIIKKVSNGDARIISLIENIQREDLNDIDRASALRELKVNLGSPWEAIAKSLGLTKRRILDLVGLLDLPDEIKEDIRHKRITEKHGRALRQLLNKPEVLRELVNFMKEEKLTGDQSLELVRKVKSEPRFTIEESYNKIQQSKGSTKKTSREPVDSAIAEGERLIKFIRNLEPEKLSLEKKEILRSNFQKIKNIIDSILEEI